MYEVKGDARSEVRGDSMNAQRAFWRDSEKQVVQNGDDDEAVLSMILECILQRVLRSVCYARRRCG